MARLVNVRGLRPGQEIHYIGRQFGGWNASELQNPFRVRNNRTWAITKYVVYLVNELIAEIESNNRGEPAPKIDELRSIAKSRKAIGCWCVPRACHGHFVLWLTMVIRGERTFKDFDKFLDWLVSQGGISVEMTDDCYLFRAHGGYDQKVVYYKDLERLCNVLSH